MGAALSGIRWRKVSLNGLDLWPESRRAGVDEPIVLEWAGLGSASWDAPTGRRAGADGNWSGTPRREAKSYMVRGITTHRDEISADAWVDKLVASAVGKDLPLTFHYASGPRTALVRVPEVKIDRPQPTVTEWQFSPVADDPAWYLGDGFSPAWSGTTTRAFEVGGVSFPLSFPFSWASEVVSGQLVFRNPGTTGKVLFRLDGPLTDPVITTTNGEGVRTLSWSLSLPAGAYLLVDPAKRQALLQGQASRPPVLRGWPRLTAGQNHWRFHAFGDSSGTLTVQAWAAY